MEQFVIEGGKPLSGTIKASGNKNAAIKMIPACLLTEEPVVLRNMPNIGDVRTTLDIMRQLGAKVSWLDSTSVRIHAQHINTTEIDPVSCEQNSRERRFRRADAGTHGSHPPTHSRWR